VNATSYRAWRFTLPELDGPPGESGIRLDAVGKVGMVAGEAAVRQALLLLLSTQPGERVMRPTFGCHLQRLVFSPNETNAQSY
jgi:hypothetical protein